MVNVELISDLLLKGEFLLESVEFPESPKMGDYVDVLSFEAADSDSYLEDYLKKNNKISHGFVNGRSWKMLHGKLTLMVLIDFEDDVKNDGAKNDLEKIANFL